MDVVERALVLGAAEAERVPGVVLPSWLGLVVLAVVLAIAIFVALHRRGGSWRRPRSPAEDGSQLKDSRRWGGPPQG